MRTVPFCIVVFPPLFGRNPYMIQAIPDDDEAYSAFRKDTLRADFNMSMDNILKTLENIDKDLEERGSCYAVGSGNAGQLGQGDLEPRNVFTVR